MGRKRKKAATAEKLTCSLVIRISATEKERLKQRALEKGYQDTAKYCRMILKNFEVMEWSDINRELKKIKNQIGNLDGILQQIEKNVAYGTYPRETEQRFQDYVAQMKELSKKLEQLLKERREKEGKIHGSDETPAC